MSKRSFEISDINNFLTKELRTNRFGLETDINRELGVSGDDFDELIEAFSERFNVELDKYLWYFHTEEEGVSISGSLFYRTPDQRVTRIPVTAALLLEVANCGHWNVDYPPHQFPERRYDIIFNKIFILVLVVSLSVLFLYKYFFRT